MVARSEKIANYVVLGVLAAVVMFPIVHLLLSALRPQDEPSVGLVPSALAPQNFVDAWQHANLGGYVRNSVIIAVGVVVLTVIGSILGGYALGVLRVRGAGLLLGVFLVGILVPLESIIVPLYYTFREVGLTDSYPGLILVQVGLNMSFGIFWMRAFFRSVPTSLVEAAKLDGASSWGTLWRILVPVGRPAVITLVLLSFMWAWNDFFLALIMMSDPAMRPVTLGLSFFQGQHVTNVTLLSAAAVVICVPVIVLYVVFQRHFIRGMLAGAIKE